jgi:hypothetical protein
VYERRNGRRYGSLNAGAHHPIGHPTDLHGSCFGFLGLTLMSDGDNSDDGQNRYNGNDGSM